MSLFCPKSHRFNNPERNLVNKQVDNQPEVVWLLAQLLLDQVRICLVVHRLAEAVFFVRTVTNPCNSSR